ncbi:MAG TPA: alpha,alpha-trehalase TreF [Burkholderiaceae bacterium]|jgi:alpha,alpha-trehalase
MKSNSPERLAAVKRELSRSPSQLYGALFVDVQMQKVFDDRKTFVDATPKTLTPEALRTLYATQRGESEFSLADFVAEHFELPSVAKAAVLADVQAHESVRSALSRHIAELWPQLVRHTRTAGARSEADSLIELPQPYVVPGGRFREIYYWDSYFTMLGLIEDGRRDLAQGMLDNFAKQISTYGHVPNGNRSYFISRSQPPFFFKMIELLAGESSVCYAPYLSHLECEYDYWMEGAQALAPGHAHRHVVRLADGSLLNRYWDDLDTPREESYREDVRTAQRSTARPLQAVWRDLRAGAESGWDFSSRWCADPGLLETIETTAIAPIDLNSLMFGLERAIAAGRREIHDEAGAADFEARAERRRTVIDTHLWNEDLGHYVDLHWAGDKSWNRLTAAALAPLFLGLANDRQAHATALAVQGSLLTPFGLMTTAQTSPHQWDAPNGWAPLQWMAVQGLRRYGQTELARTIALRWLETVESTYLSTGKLFEKYDVVKDGSSARGEYAMQDGFGWTNASYVALARLYPET